MGKKIAADLREKKQYADQLQEIQKGKQYFARVIQARKDDWQEEYKYWLKKGWL